MSNQKSNLAILLIVAIVLFSCTTALNKKRTAQSADPVQNLIDNMQKDSDLPASGGNPGAYKPGINFPGTYESVRDACGEKSNLAGLLDFVITWTWVWEGKDNQASNTRVACRHARAYWLSKSTGKWNLAFDVRPWGVTWPMTWKDGKNTTPFMEPGKVSGRGVGNQRNEPEGVYVMSCKPSLDTCYELWGRAEIGNVAFRDVRAWYLATDVKLIVDNPDLPDDRDRAKYIVSVGADFGTSQRDKTPNAVRFGIDDNRKNSRNQPDGYPNCIVDGFHSRYRLISKEWMTVDAISMGPQYQKEYGNRPPPPWGPPWGDLTYRPDTNAWPYTRPPYVLTEDEVRSNPPPFN